MRAPHAHHVLANVDGLPSVVGTDDHWCVQPLDGLRVAVEQVCALLFGATVAHTT